MVIQRRNENDKRNKKILDKNINVTAACKNSVMVRIESVNVEFEKYTLKK